MFAENASEYVQGTHSGTDRFRLDGPDPPELVVGNHIKIRDMQHDHRQPEITVDPLSPLFA
jgi:hypothetical protein